LAVDGPKVELFWWEGCPSWRQASEVLAAAMAAAGLDPDSASIIEIATDEDAERHGFVGSPTIRIDGQDLQPPSGEPIGLSCRVYRLRNGRVSPLPDPGDLRDALARARSERR
jgi:hypothetical protein